MPGAENQVICEFGGSKKALFEVQKQLEEGKSALGESIGQCRRETKENKTAVDSELANIHQDRAEEARIVERGSVEV